MALNKYMHPRNVYKSRKPDFKALAIKYDYFREKVTQNLSGKMILDFKDPSALRALTQALLESDFGLIVTLPLDRLIPTVPQRYNYILWLEDMIGENKPATGIDIGTGASCIYPLLGCRQNGWKFIASDIDDQNIQFATKNVEQNKMQDKVTIKKVSEETILLGLVDEATTYDFCMCNPPFFTDHLEAQGVTSTRKDDRSKANSISTASEKESIAWGGEVRFLTQMIEESLVLKDKVRVYTSLLGKKASISLLKDELHKKKVTKFSTTEFCQGRTMRWGIAWTFDDTIQFPKSSFKELKNVKPPLMYEIPRTAGTGEDYTVQAYSQCIRTILEQLQINYHVKHNGKFYTCMYLQAKENTWSHQRRKRRKDKQSNETTDIKATAIGDDSASNNENITEGNLETCHIKSNTECVNAAAMTIVTDKSSDKDSTAEGSDKKLDAIVKDPEKDLKMTAAGDNKVIVKTDTNEAIHKTGITETGNNVDVEQDDSMNIGKEDNDSEKKHSDISKLNKRTLNDAESESDCKRFKHDKELPGEELADKVTNETVSKVCEEVSTGLCASGDDASEKDIAESAKLDKNSVPSDDERPSFLVRKDVIEQFWKEQESNRTRSMEKTKVSKSVFEKTEDFDLKEECLLLCKMVLRKDEGVMTFTLTYSQGNREAMHQIMQFFKNKFTA